jgi:hypothetical protein
MKMYDLFEVLGANAHGAEIAILCVFSLAVSSLSYAAPLPLGAAGYEAVCRASYGYEDDNQGMGPGRVTCSAHGFSPCAIYGSRGAARATYGYHTAFARVQGSAYISIFNPECIPPPGGVSYTHLRDRPKSLGVAADYGRWSDEYTISASTAALGNPYSGSRCSRQLIKSRFRGSSCR